MNSNNIIEVRNLTKRYGDNIADNNISFNVLKGEIITILGPNGAGKSTLIKMLTGVIAPTKGSIFINNYKMPSERNMIIHDVGVAPQDTGLFEFFTLYQHLFTWAKFHYPSKIAKQKTEAMIKQFNMENEANKKVEILSGGNRRKMILMLTLIGDPNILLLDEPTTGLDPGAQRMIWKIIKDYSTRGKTFIITTHNMDESKVLSDRILFLNMGNLIGIGNIEKLLEKCNYKYRIDITELTTEQKSLLFTTFVGRIWLMDEKNVVLIHTLEDVMEITNYLSNNKLLENNLHIERATLTDIFMQLTNGDDIIES